MDKPGPISFALCGVAALATLFVSIVFLPAAELLPAQVNPAPRTSGESFVSTLPGAADVMKSYANTGVEILKMLPRPGEKEAEQKPASNADPVAEWQTKLHDTFGPKYAPVLSKNIEESLGGDQNLKTVLGQMQSDKNFVYNAYALFMGLALLLGAIAIQAMGRWGAEEKTILPAKK